MYKARLVVIPSELYAIFENRRITAGINIFSDVPVMTWFAFMLTAA